MTVLEGNKMVLGRHLNIFAANEASLHSCVLLNNSSCYTTVIRYRLDYCPPVVVLVLCLQEWGCRNVVTSRLTSKLYEVRCAGKWKLTLIYLRLRVLTGGSGLIFCHWQRFFLQPVKCFISWWLQLNFCLLLQHSQSLYLHNWLVKDRGM